MDTPAARITLVCATCRQTNRLPVQALQAQPRCGACGDPLADGKVIELDAETHDKAIRQDGLPLLVDYWAAWCGPCRSMAPEFAKVAGQVRGRLRLAKLDTEAHPDLARRARIQGIPALVLYRDGREVARLAGARPAAQILDFLARSGALPTA